MRFLLTGIILLFTLGSVQAQKYFTRTGQITFHSETDLEDIHAENRSAVSVIDLANGRVEFSVLMKGFIFEKALMQEHFNENYIESHKYPKAIFKGQFETFDASSLSTDEDLAVHVKGVLTVREIGKEIDIITHLRKKGDGISGSTGFIVSPADFQIVIPSIVRDNIAKEIEVKVQAEYVELKK